MAGAKNFNGLITARFFLGLFEATIGESFPLLLRANWNAHFNQLSSVLHNYHANGQSTVHEVVLLSNIFLFRLVVASPRANYPLSILVRDEWVYRNGRWST